MKILGEACKIIKKSNSDNSIYAFNMFFELQFYKISN